MLNRRAFPSEWIYGLSNLFVLFLITLYVESISTGRMLVLDGFIKESVCKAVLESPIVILSILGGTSLLLYVLSHRKGSKKEEQKLLNNVCRFIFDTYIKNNDNLVNSQMRVSVLRAENRITFNWLHNWYFAYGGRETFLTVVARHQTIMAESSSAVRFRPGEGCAGIAYSSNTIIAKNISKFDESNPDRYYQDSTNIFKLPKQKAQKLNTKACSFLCCPIKFFGTDNVFGVLSIDCVDQTILSDETFQEIKKSMQQLSIIFNV